MNLKNAPSQLTFLTVFWKFSSKFRCLLDNVCILRLLFGFEPINSLVIHYGPWPICFSKRCYFYDHFVPSLLSTPNGSKALYLVAEESCGGAGIRGVRVRNRLVRADSRSCPADPRSCTEESGWECTVWIFSHVHGQQRLASCTIHTLTFVHYDTTPLWTECPCSCYLCFVRRRVQRRWRVPRRPRPGECRHPRHAGAWRAGG